METVDQLYEAIVEANIAKAEKLADLATKNLGHQQVLTEILTQLLNRIGNIEQTAVLNLAQGYVISKLVKQILADYEQAANSTRSSSPLHGTVILCNAEDDCHPIGAKSLLRFCGAPGGMSETSGSTWRHRSWLTKRSAWAPGSWGSRP